MIGYLSGILQKTLINPIIVNVKGVGYAVNVTPTFLTSIKNNEQINLYIATIIKDENIQLFGFQSQEEKDLFLKLLSVSGIGPKTALLVQDRGCSAVKQAISTADVEFFTATPRLGKKNAQKIIIELKNKIGSVEELDLKEDASGFTRQVAEALSSMGFAKSEIRKVLASIRGDYTKVEDVLREALKKLG